MSTETKVVHQQETLFTFLKAHSNERGYVKGLDINKLARLTGLSDHDVAKTLWGMQKRNLVGFSEKKGTNGHSVPYRFRIKKAGLALRELPKLPEPTLEPAEHDSVEATPKVRPPKRKDHITELLNRESDLRFCADTLSDYGLEELGVQVLEHVKLSNDELQALREFFEVQ